MLRLAATIISIALFIALIAAISVPQAEATSSQLQIGVFFPDPQLPDEQLPSINDLHNFENSIGRQTNVFLWYESIGEDFYTDTFLPMAQEGRIIQLAWEPHDFSLPATNQPAYRLNRITAGNFDNDIRRWARELRDFGYPIYFRPMSEMNGDWVTWGGTVNGNSPQDYIPAWRHIHDIFVQEGANNVMWVWSPNRDGSTADAQATFNTYYPGNNYVDYIGINGYNWGTLYNTPEWTSIWQSFEEVISYSYDVAAANTNKPIVICETATTEVGGNAQNGGKAQWITDAFNILPSRFPRVAMLTWFNINKETDWRIESSAASLAAFSAAVGTGPVRPDLTLSDPHVYWASYADYQASNLNVDISAGNFGGTNAYFTNVTGSTASNGVVCQTPMPLSLGTIAGGDSSSFTLKYRVPAGVANFQAMIFVTAEDGSGNTYEYPGV
jgi:hypothetical protein